METKITKAVVSLTVVIICVAAILMPVITDATTTTVVTDNEGSWAKLAYASDATTTDYDFSVTVSSGTVTVGTMSGTTDTIIYSDDEGALIAVDGEVSYIYSDNGTATRTVLGSEVTVTNVSGTLTISDGVTVLNATPTWAYYPDADGAYCGCSAEEIKNACDPLAAVGYYAGVYTYNSICVPDYNLVLDTEVEDNDTVVKWVLED